MLDQEPLVPTDRIELVWHGIDHAEGLAIAGDGTVWAGGELGQIYRGHLDGEPEHVADVPGRAWGFTLDGAGNAYVATTDESGLYRVTVDGRVDLVSRGTPERPLVMPNHPALLPDGTLLFTDSGNWGQADGCIYAVTPGGETRVADTTASSFTNGLTVSPDGATLAVVESTLPGVSVLTIGADGSLGDRHVLVEMPGTVPDGVTYDELGRLLVSCWAPDALFLLGPGGLRLLAHDPVRIMLHEPTNAAFVPGTRRIVTANYGERFLSVFEHDARGAPLPRPEFAWAP